MLDFECIAVFDDPELGARGNIAAVIVLEESMPEQAMQRIATDLSQPATTFLWPTGEQGSYHVRWFAPDAEIGLCGHGTLAAVAALQQSVTLYAQSGQQLSGHIVDNSYASMQLAAIPVTSSPKPPDGLEKALGVSIKGYFKTNNKDIVLLENESSLVSMDPDFGALQKIDVFGYAVTAPGDSCDFVSRTLVPHVRQLEDHATGSSHAALVPFWSDKLGKSSLKGIQRSPRGGVFQCDIQRDLVTLTGHFSQVINGKIHN